MPVYLDFLLPSAASSRPRKISNPKAHIMYAGKTGHEQLFSVSASATRSKRMAYLGMIHMKIKRNTELCPMLSKPIEAVSQLVASSVIMAYHRRLQ